MANSMGLTPYCNQCDVLGRKGTKFGELTQKIKAITSFKVIQGHRFRYQWKARIMRLPHILHRFRDMADYWSNCRRRRRVPLFNAHALLRTSPCIRYGKIWLQETRNIPILHGAKHRLFRDLDTCRRDSWLWQTDRLAHSMPRFTITIRGA